jgi:uncharacterized protein
MLDSSTKRYPFLSRLLVFVDLLRASEIIVSISETIDAAEALQFLDLGNLEQFRNGLRITLVKRHQDYDKFDQLFRSFWRPASDGRSLGRISLPAARKKVEASRDKSLGASSEGDTGKIPTDSLLSSAALPPSGKEKILGIYSPLETISRKSFEDLSVVMDRALLKRGMRSFARATATRPGRRFSSANGNHVDFRGTLRRSLETGGGTIALYRRKSKLTKSRLVILCDISGSMDPYSGRILKLIYHLCNTVRGTKIFGFSTRVVPLNNLLEGRSLKEASRLVSEHVQIWSSGTRIGSALRDLISNYSGNLTSSTTIFVIISDGWELGNIRNLQLNMAELRRRVRGIVWLNPQADNIDYAPMAEGMKNALPYVDIFAGLDIFSDRTKFLRAFKDAHMILSRGN